MNDNLNLNITRIDQGKSLIVALRRVSIAVLATIAFVSNCFGGALDYMGYRIGYDHVMKYSGGNFKRDYVAGDTLVDGTTWYKVVSCKWDTAQKECVNNISWLYYSEIDGDLYSTFDFSAKGLNPIVYLKSSQYQDGGYTYRYINDTIEAAGETRFEFHSLRADPMGTMWVRRFVYGLGLVEESVSMLISGDMKTQWSAYLCKDCSTPASVSTSMNRHRKSVAVVYANIAGQKIKRVSNSSRIEKTIAISVDHR